MFRSLVAGLALCGTMAGAGVVDPSVLHGPIDPPAESRASFRNGDMRIDAVVRGVEKRATLTVQPSTAPSWSLALSRDVWLEQVDAVYAYRSTAVLIGREHEAVYRVAVVDLTARKEVATFLAYDLAVSPDGRYLAFARFHPLHFVPDPEWQARLYDLELSAEENYRPALAASGVPGYQEEDNAGRPLLLPGHEADLRPNLDVPPELAHEWYADFAWTPDSRKLFFGEMQGGVIRLVEVDLATASPRIKGRVIPSDLCKPSCSSWRVRKLTLDHGDGTALLANLEPDGGERVFRFRY